MRAENVIWGYIRIPRNVGESEGMTPHIPNWVSILEVGVLVDLQIFKEQFERSKFIELKTLSYHWKILKT